MKLHKGDKIEITILKNGALLFKLNNYIQHGCDEGYILKRCGLTWQQVAIKLKSVDKVLINI